MKSPAIGDHATTDRLSDRAHESMDQMGKTAGKVKEQIQRGAADAEAQVRNAGQKVQELSDETLNSVSVFVRDNPLTALGIAIAAGTLISAVIRQS